ncbi:FtsH protease activity modulator HflK [Novosphingobium sp.]|uniref:FtsH protease activity modulator HflK n=1 Tax=Novosphingobium sp. TaxID=1874826 RepID=UPI003BA94E6C
MAGKKSPWGGGEAESGEPSGQPAADGGDASPDSPPPPPRGNGPRNPWLPPSSGEGRRGQTLEDLFKRRGGGGGGSGGPGFRLPQLPGGGSWAPVAIGIVVLLWLGTTMVHRVSPQEKGVVTTFGAYSHTIDSGVSLTLPWPIQAVTVEDVTSIRRDSIPEGDGERLMLTGDQNLVDLTYLVRWNIKDLKLYTFQLAEPDATVKEVAEAAMRQSIAEVTLNDAMGSGRASIEANVRERMQRILDAYRSGVKIQGVEIKKTDPPAKVVDAFKEVLAAQQDAQSEVNRAEQWANQLTQRAQGEATAFDKVYAQYKLAPEVTRRRMYYETMERVLSQTDKVILEAPGVMPYLPLPGLKQTPPADNTTERR